MSDDPLREPIIAAGEALARAIAQELPGLSAGALGWLRALTTTGRPADYFLHSRRFPVVRLPFWAVEDRLPDPVLLGDVLRSTMAGYWFVRLVDDLVDREARAPLGLLPLSAFLHTEFEGGFRRHFPATSPFWPVFRQRWLRLADATTITAAAPTAEDLVERATATIGAAAIPLCALTLAAGVPERFEPWAAAVDGLARVEQLVDDLVDWQSDHDRRQPNILLAEGTRRVGSEALPGWVVREGFRWGLDQARRAIDRVDLVVAGLGSAPLSEFLRGRRAALEALDAETAAGLAQLGALAASFPDPAPPSR